MLAGPRRATLGGCGGVVLLDVAQLGSGLSGHEPAAAGAALYAALAVGIGLHRREAAWVLVMMPWVPLLATLAWLVGLSPRAPHGMMAVVAVVQLITGLAAAQSLDLQGAATGPR